MKELSEQFDKNIPKSLLFDKGYLYFIIYIFCVDENVNIEEICNKYKVHRIGNSYKIEIVDYMYNNKIIHIICIRNVKKLQKNLKNIFVRIFYK